MEWPNVWSEVGVTKSTIIRMTWNWRKRCSNKLSNCLIGKLTPEPFKSKLWVNMAAFSISLRGRLCKLRIMQIEKNQCWLFTSLDKSARGSLPLATRKTMAAITHVGLRINISGPKWKHIQSKMFCMAPEFLKWIR